MYYYIIDDSVNVIQARNPVKDSDICNRLQINSFGNMLSTLNHSSNNYHSMLEILPHNHLTIRLPYSEAA